MQIYNKAICIQISHPTPQKPKLNIQDLWADLHFSSLFKWFIWFENYISKENTRESNRFLIIQSEMMIPRFCT